MINNDSLDSQVMTNIDRDGVYPLLTIVVVHPRSCLRHSPAVAQSLGGDRHSRISQV